MVIITTCQSQHFRKAYKRAELETYLDWEFMLKNIQECKQSKYQWNLVRVFISYNAYCLGMERASEINKLPGDKLAKDRRALDARKFPDLHDLLVPEDSDSERRSKES